MRFHGATDSRTPPLRRAPLRRRRLMLRDLALFAAVVCFVPARPGGTTAKGCASSRWEPSPLTSDEIHRSQPTTFYELPGVPTFAPCRRGTPVFTTTAATPRPRSPINIGLRTCGLRLRATQLDRHSACRASMQAESAPGRATQSPMRRLQTRSGADLNIADDFTRRLHRRTTVPIKVPNVRVGFTTSRSSQFRGRERANEGLSILHRWNLRDGLTRPSPTPFFRRHSRRTGQIRSAFVEITRAATNRHHHQRREPHRIASTSTERRPIVS